MHYGRKFEKKLDPLYREAFDLTAKSHKWKLGINTAFKVNDIERDIKAITRKAIAYFLTFLRLYRYKLVLL